MSADGLQQHSLRPLLQPRSVALVGASERAGSLGRIVLDNALAAAFDGELHAVNPRHARVLGRPCLPRLTALGAAVDLAAIAAPAYAVLDILDDAARAGVHAAILLTSPPEGATEGEWTRDVAQRAAHHRIRLVGPGAFGLVRTAIGLNASITDVPVLRGRLALVAQSGAVCTAMLDFAAPMHIGFSTVVSVGAGVDINFGEMLDLLLLDGETDGILLHVESVRDARRFVSALRAAARTKPVIVLKAGRSHEAIEDGSAPSPDAVFDAAMRRAGTVRVRTYTQLFAAARILALGRIPRGDRIAIVANGRGPAVLAADVAIERGIRLAAFEPATLDRLDALLPAGGERGNPVDARADAPPERLAGVVAAVLNDANVDAVVVLHVPRSSIDVTDAARAVATVAKAASKPVLAAWLGAIDRPDVRAALESGGIANFYTPENAVEAFSFLAAYRRHQAWLLEVAPAQDEPQVPDLAAAADVLRKTEGARETLLSEEHAMQLLSAFGLHLLPSGTARTGNEAKQLARRFGYPVMLEAATPQAVLRRDHLDDARAVARAFDALTKAAAPLQRRGSASGIVIRRSAGEWSGQQLSVGVHTDATFGPVLAFGASLRANLAGGERALMLPPLNDRLALDLVNVLRDRRHGIPLDDVQCAALVDLLLRVSALVCALPWVVEMELDPVTPALARASISVARIVVDPRRAGLRRHAHMAIHPYPFELVSQFRARNGTRVVVRPIRPEDAELERRFVSTLSDETRYRRFFYRMHELTPAMLARFTQVDYDRELALVAVVDDRRAAEGISFAGVARYVEYPDRLGAEYAIVVHDDWQKQRIGRALMERLIAAAKDKGLERLEGTVLRDNAEMLAFVSALGFAMHEDPGDGQQLITTLELHG